MISFKDFIKKIYEAKGKEVTFIFGRMNPPTKGHEVMINEAKAFAKKNGSELIVFPSQTKDKKKNPISSKDKTVFLKKLFKGTKIIVDEKLKTPFQVVESLIDKNYDKIYMVVGGDREDDFRKRFNQYYDNVEVINSGKRVKGVSATDLRNAAVNDDFETFKKGLPSSANDKLAKQIFMSVQQGLK